jgi:hypothetical protein
VRSDYSLRLIADLNLSDTPALPRLDALRNQATSAFSRIIIIAAEAGGVAAHANSSGHHRWLNHADSRQCDHGYNRLPHRSILSPHWKQHFRGGIIRRSNIVRGKLTVSRQSQDK